MAEIDWSVFDKDPECTIYCWCGAIYRSHAKIKSEVENGKMVLNRYTRRACPQCGKSKNHTQRISSDPEQWDIRG